MINRTALRNSQGCFPFQHYYDFQIFNLYPFLVFKNAYAVAPRSLCVIQGQVGLLDKYISFDIGSVQYANSHTECKRIPEVRRTSHRGADSLSHFQRADGLSFRQDERKLFAPDAGYHIRSTAPFLEAQHYKLQSLVPSRVAECIVIFFEVVNIQYDDSQVASESSAAVHLITEKEIEITTVMHACQGIGQ